MFEYIQGKLTARTHKRRGRKTSVGIEQCSRKWRINTSRLTVTVTIVGFNPNLKLQGVPEKETLHLSMFRSLSNIYAIFRNTMESLVQ